MGKIRKKQNQAMEAIAALLTVHNRREQTLTCLDKLYAQSMPDDVKLDVFLVDDGSTDGTTQAVNNRFPKVHVIPADGSLYWNRGMHRAWKMASQTMDYDYYLWLNDDTILFDNAISELIALCQEYENRVIAVGATKASKTETLTYGGRVGTKVVPCDGNHHEVERFNGNIALVPKSVFHILGNLDYYYTHSKGDFDYGIRAQKQGIKMYQCGVVLGICDEHERIDSWCDPEIPLSKRWSLMLQPNGMPPDETFYYEKQMNVLMAAVHFITVPLRCLFPKLWIRLKANPAR